MISMEEIHRRFTAPANIDWCEANFVHSPLIAEFYNTLSSIPLAAIPLFGVCYTRCEEIESLTPPFTHTSHSVNCALVDTAPSPSVMCLL